MSTSSRHLLFCDLETFSEAPIAKTGAQRYIMDPSFEILLFAYSVDGQPVQIIDLASGEQVPEWLQTALINPAYIKHAYNAPFEFCCLSRYYGQLYPAQWRCTMLHGMYCGYTAGLDATGRALGLPEDKQKLKTGRDLIRYFCVPCKPTKSNGLRTRNYPHHDPEKWQLFKEYNAQDVVTEMEIERRLSQFPVPDFVQKQWETDLVINLRGVAVDLPFVDGALAVGEQVRAEMIAEAERITNLDNPNSVSQLKEWLNRETGIEIDSLSKDVVKKMLNRDDNSPDVQKMLRIRQELGKTSTKKYDAIKMCVCPDNRVRGLLQFYGASKTGRWAGRLVQVQNLPRTYTDPIGIARELVRNRKTDALRCLYGSVSDTLSQLIRTAFVSSPGNVLIDADFSAIEARVISWLAGERWRLDAFRAGRDIYCETASKMFSVPVELIKKGNPEYALRAKGKVAELACIAEGQEVLTDHGLVPIEGVTTAMRLWDGKEWVKHGGVVYKGVKEVITYDGLTATKDHIVWAEVEGAYRAVRLGNAASGGSRLVKSGSGRAGIRLAENHFAGTKIHKKLVTVHGSNGMHRLRKNRVDCAREHDAGQDKRMSELFPEESNSEVAGQKIYCSETAMHKSERSRIPELRGERDKIRIRKRKGRLPVHDRNVRFTRQVIGNRPDKREWELCSRKPEMGNASAELPKSAKVYDIVNAGPRNRFTVSNALVHNCGYQGGTGALIAMGALDMGLHEEELQEIVNRWRNANKNIVDLWYRVQAAAVAAIENGQASKLYLKPCDPEMAAHSEGITFRREYDENQGVHVLTIQLPSGRKLFYIDPKIGVNRYGGPSITYMGVDQTSKQWKAIETYGGKLTENIVQAVARDCLAEAIGRLEAAGFPIVFHVHDEVVIDIKPFADNETMLQQVCDIMRQSPYWGQDLPLDAAGWVGEFFTKD